MTHLIALLARPTSQSFGMVPIVIADDEGQVNVCGLAAASAPRAAGFNRARLEQLIRMGHALPVAVGALPRPASSSSVALWLGDDFVKDAAAAGLALPPFPPQPYVIDGGRFYVGSAKALYVYLEYTVARAFSCAREHETQRALLVELMQRTLPLDPLTTAATLLFSADHHVEYSWQRALGVTTDTEERALERARATWDTYSSPLDSIRLVAVIGKSGSQREQAASLLANRLQAAFRSFVEPIKKQVPEGLMPNELKLCMMEIGQREFEQSPLAFVLDALNLDQLNDNHLIVVDSVRHRLILTVLEWLFSDTRVWSVGVTAREEIQIQRLKHRMLQPDRVFTDPTEVEIVSLLTQADRRINGEANLSEELSSLQPFVQ